MATLRIHFRAESLSKEENMTVILSEQVDAPDPYPVLLQLHGMSMGG